MNSTKEITEFDEKEFEFLNYEQEVRTTGK